MRLLRYTLLSALLCLSMITKPAAPEAGGANDDSFKPLSIDWDPEVMLQTKFKNLSDEYQIHLQRYRKNKDLSVLSLDGIEKDVMWEVVKELGQKETILGMINNFLAYLYSEPAPESMIPEAPPGEQDLRLASPTDTPPTHNLFPYAAAIAATIFAITARSKIDNGTVKNSAYLFAALTALNALRVAKKDLSNLFSKKEALAAFEVSKVTLEPAVAEQAPRHRLSPRKLLYTPDEINAIKQGLLKCMKKLPRIPKNASCFIELLSALSSTDFDKAKALCLKQASSKAPVIITNEQLKSALERSIDRLVDFKWPNELNHQRLLCAANYYIATFLNNTSDDKDQSNNQSRAILYNIIHNYYTAQKNAEIQQRLSPVVGFFKAIAPSRTERSRVPIREIRNAFERIDDLPEKIEQAKRILLNQKQVKSNANAAYNIRDFHTQAMQSKLYQMIVDDHTAGIGHGFSVIDPIFMNSEIIEGFGIP